LFAATPASAQAAPPAGHEQTAFDFMNLLAEHGLHDIARIGIDGRLVGAARSAFRLGAGAQLFVPNGTRSEYDTDDTYRAMGRVLFAGDLGPLWYPVALALSTLRLLGSP
jgi:hypothetical protein